MRDLVANTKAKRASQLAVLLLATWLPTGCVFSINPLYTEKDLVFMPELIGKWQNAKDRGSAMTFTKSDENVYTVAVTDDGKELRFDGRLFKVGNLLMLDLYPEKDLDTINDDQLLPLHCFGKIEVESGTLRMVPWNYDYLDELLVQRKLRIAHTRLKDAMHGPFGTSFDEIVLTGTTAELQKRLREIENDPRAFSKDEAVEYQRQE